MIKIIGIIKYFPELTPLVEQIDIIYKDTDRGLIHTLAKVKPSVIEQVAKLEKEIENITNVKPVLSKGLQRKYFDQIKIRKLTKSIQK